MNRSVLRRLAVCLFVSLPCFAHSALGAPANQKCPMSGEALPANPPTISFEGKEIAFCCAMCRTGFGRLGADEQRAAVAKVVGGVAPGGAPTAEAPAEARIANTMCPISGNPIDAAAPTARVGAYEVGFCCAGCRSGFLGWSEEKRNAFVAPLTDPVAVNEVCPVSGREVADGAPTIAVGDSIVGFCCDRCPPRFERWDDARKDAYLQELLAQTPINSACPVSGAKVDDGFRRIAHRGVVVALRDDAAVAAWRVMGVEAQNVAIAQMAAVNKPINSICPVGDEPIDARTRLVYKGKVIGFCCPGCDSAFAGWPEAEKDAWVAKQRND